MAEADIEGTLVLAFDQQIPRGSVSTDLPTDIATYLKQFPGVLKTHSDTALEDDAVFLNRTTPKIKKNKTKKTKQDKVKTTKSRRQSDAPPSGTTATSTTASKRTDTAASAAPTTTKSRKSGRTRTQTQPFSLITEPQLQLQLYDQLNELCITDIDNFERAVGDISFASDVARDYFGTTLLCGWNEDYGDLAVHITTLDDESSDRPLQAANGPHVTRVHHRIMDDAHTRAERPHRHTKGRRLPRPDSYMGRGVLFQG